MSQIVLGNLAASGNPDVTMAGDVFQSLFESLHSMGAAHLVVVSGDAHDGAGFLAFLVQAIEMPLQHGSVVAGFHFIYGVYDCVIHLQ